MPLPSAECCIAGTGLGKCLPPTGDGTLQIAVWHACTTGLTAADVAYITALPNKQSGVACPAGTA